MGTVVPGTVKEPASEPSLFSTFIVNFFKTSHSVSRSFQIWSQFGQIKGCKRCLKILRLSLLPTAELRHLDDNAALPSKHWVLLGPNWQEFSPAIQEFKANEMIKFKAQFGNCTLQSYRCKIYLRRTETSVINNEFAKVVAYLCELKVVRKCTLISWNRLIRAWCLHMQLVPLNIIWKWEKPYHIETKSPPVYQLRC